MDEDEDVVIEGSALHEHLSKLGYSDFESIAVQKSCAKQETVSKTTGIRSFIRIVSKNLHSIYLWITQERSSSVKQLKTILKTEVLLDDHAVTVQGLVERCSSRSRLTKLQELIPICCVKSLSLYLLRPKNKLSAILLTSTLYVAFYITIQIIFSRVSAQKDLKCLISLQNELFHLCKKALKILRHGYKIKPGPGKSVLPFHDLTGKRLKYVQPMVENLVNCLENVSSICHQSSLLIIKLLPKNALTEHSVTQFETDSFKIHGEINYQALKNLYHTYILVQSEMLHLLATAYNSDTWLESCDRIPEVKLAYIIHTLIKHLTVHTNKLSKVIDAYYSQELEPIRHEYRGPAGSKWQDLYVHLDLTSSKIQQAYNQISSILKDIDMCINESTDNTEMVEVMMQKMNEAYKQIDTARNFAEFSSLLIAKARLINSRDNENSMTNTFVPDANPDLPVVTDSEPQIVDEVFEEYIKEEYIKPLYEESDEFQDYKLDKLLAKNFLSELKEALIDKHKSMSERESKALQRMYKNVVRDSSEVNNSPSIPVPPPMNLFNICSAPSKAEDYKEKKGLDTDVLDPTLRPGNKEKQSINLSAPKPQYGEKEEENPVFIPQMRFQVPTSQFGTAFPPSFLKTEEETFIGSGENSEDESESGKNEDDENSQ